MKMLKGKKKGKLWLGSAGIVAFFAVLFMVLFSVRGGSEVHAADGYSFLSVGTLIGPASLAATGDNVAGTMPLQATQQDIAIVPTGNNTGETYLWESTAPNCVDVVGDSSDSSRATVTLKGAPSGNDTIGARVTVIDANKNRLGAVVIYFSISFKINQYLNGVAANGATFTEVSKNDTKKSLILYYGDGDADTNAKPPVGSTLSTGISSTEDTRYLTLLLRDATQVQWTSADTSVVAVSTNEVGMPSLGDPKDPNKPLPKREVPAIQAIGAGHTQLTATSSDGQSDTIDVYVVPSIYRIRGQETTFIGGYRESTHNTNSPYVDIANNDILQVTIGQGGSAGFSDKVAWVITRQVGQKRILVRDSLENVGTDPQAYPDDIQLGDPDSEGKMRVHAKAGLYQITFFAGDTYKSFEESLDVGDNNPEDPTPEALRVTVPLRVASSYTKTKEVTVGVGGSYDLSEALGISKEVLVGKDGNSGNFDIRILDETKPLDQDIIDEFNISSLGTSGESFVKQDSKDKTILRTTNNLGTARVLVTAKQDVAEIPGEDGTKIAPGQMCLITIRVIDTFSLNVTNTTMAVGSTLNLTGLIGSGTHAESSQFKWTWDSQYVDLDSDTGQNVTVTAKKKTDNGKNTIVTLSWTDSDGVTWVSSCSLVITDADPNFSIDPPTKELAVGETYDLNLKTTLSGDQPNIIWFTADETICTVEALQGNLAARITAGNKTGQTIITAFNKENNAYATCIVTVTSEITAISIDKGEEYRLNSTTLFAFLKAIYEPADATETELKWSVKAVQGTDVVKLEPDGENATLTINKAGIVDVTVEPVNNPNGVIASCRVIIEDMPITDIKTDVTKLEMVKGDKYEVKVTLTPGNPTDSTLTWSSDDTKVATVDNNGVITAAGVGTTVIKVNGGTAPTQTIMVTVRDKLQSIAFEKASDTIAVTEKKTLNVIFTPNENVKKDLTFRSTDEKIVSVNAATGEITGVAEGMAMIIASSPELGTEGTITCMITVTPEVFDVQDFNITPEEITIKEEETFEITPSFTPDNATDRRVEYVSFNEEIAEVDENGKVTGRAIGDTYIQCTSLASGISRFCHVTVETSAIVVEDFNITPVEQSIHVDETFDIVPSFTPEDVDNKEVEYISFDPDIASVDNNGTVTGLTVGDTYIQCTSVDSGISRFCHVTVETAVTLKISPTSREIAIGKSFVISKTVSPDASDTTATWKSSDKKIAAVNQNGKVTGKKIGSCIVTCTLNKYGVSASCRVKVAKLRTTVTLDKKSIRLNIGQSYKLKKTVWSNNTNTPSVKFTSKNSKIATVGQSSGRVTAKKVGSTIVTAKSADAVKATAKCRVIVIHRSTGIRLNKTYSLCYVGRTMTLKATVLPTSATVRTVKWSSSDPAIADVLSNGKVTGYATGEVYITATTTDGSNKSAKCLVKVVDPIPVTDILVAQNKITLRKGDTDNLAVTLLPSDTSDDIKMASDNKKVATVTNSGKVTAVGTGTATITITATGGVTATTIVEVVDLNRTSLSMRQYDTETLQVLGTDDTVTWYSANNRVATVANGVVTAKSIGQTTIYAYVNGCQISCSVRVASVNSSR